MTFTMGTVGTFDFEIPKIISKKFNINHLAIGFDRKHTLVNTLNHLLILKTV